MNYWDKIREVYAEFHKQYPDMPAKEKWEKAYKKMNELGQNGYGKGRF
jgi:hypothetical protein